MTSNTSAPTTIAAYILSCPASVRPILHKILKTVREAAPTAEERISYRMPAFFDHGALVYFAAFKNHIGFYPPVRDEALRKQLVPYAGPKGNLQFPLDKPMPLALITKIVKVRLRENQLRAVAKSKTAKRTSK